MDSLLETLTQSMGDEFSAQVSKSLGSNSSNTATAIDMALPLLMGALKNNTESDGGEGVMNAISKKHDGSIFDNLTELVQNPDTGEGAGILGHLFGDKLNGAEKLLASQTGVSESESAGIMKILAPMVMGALGKQAKKSSLSSSLLTEFLDKDKDGSIVDDLIDMGVKKFMS